MTIKVKPPPPTSRGKIDGVSIWKINKDHSFRSITLDCGASLSRPSALMRACQNFIPADFCCALRAYRSRELRGQRTRREKRRRGENERTSELKRFCSKSKSRHAICVPGSPHNRVSSVSPLRRGGRRQGREEERRVELTTGARCSSSFFPAEYRDAGQSLA